MKYRDFHQSIPQSSRKELNEKILYLVQQDLAEQSGISREDIYNAYTGDGGLHGLNRADFQNYHEFSEAKKEVENGQFFTPASLCQFVMELLSPASDETVADLTSGIASFCNFMPVEANFYGCELDVKSHNVARYLYPSANLERGDIRAYAPSLRFDYIVGNPPFNLKWAVDGGEVLSQLYYCQKAAELLKPLGILALLVPASFLSDEFLDKAKIPQLERDFAFLGQLSIPFGAFRALGVENYPTKLMLWQRRLSEGSELLYRTEFFGEIADLSDFSAILEKTRTSLILPAKQRRNAERTRALLAAHAGEFDEFDYETRKLLYQIRINPKTREKYAKCQEYLYKFRHQVMPEGMKYEQRQRIRITEAKVLSYLRRALRSQNQKPPVDKISLIRRAGGLVYKAYSPKTRRQLSDSQKIPIPLYKIVSELDSPEQYAPFARPIRRKQREFQRETVPFSEMTPSSELSVYLDEFSVFDRENEEEIRLNPLQKHDLNLVLQKHNTLLQWEQGSGKTLAGIAVGQYRMRFQNAKNVWIVSTAISIRNNWDVALPNYGISYRMISRLSDLEKIQPGEFVLITLNQLCKHRKQIKSHIKSRNQKICLVFDESDEMTNPDSKRTKAVLDCFRRVKFKLLMTGTVTRNNISEIAPQLELLYNNSYNCLSYAETLYHYTKDKDGGLLDMDQNAYYGRPIPAYKAGYALFASSHCPEKVTVFGVGKRSQDIYNAEALDALLSYSVITRTFEEITGKELRRIHQVPVSFSPAEREVYQKAMEDFHAMRFRYFAATGNSRKDSMMALIQQITLLLRISAAPNTVSEYTGGTPEKLKTVLSLLEDWNNQLVVVGVRHKIVVDAYAEEIRRRFPNRPLFLVTGSTTTFAQRKALRKTLRKSGNGILLCTQQSLPSSVNFEFVDKIIIPELHYNNARMSQFYMRFVRFTSTHYKDIYFVTYSGSIESNQMQMVLSKEKLNLFMKGQDVDLDEIYTRFGVDYNLMNLLMTREADENGRLQITWGEQKIS